MALIPSSVTPPPASLVPLPNYVGEAVAGAIP